MTVKEGRNIIEAGTPMWAALHWHKNHQFGLIEISLFSDSVFSFLLLPTSVFFVFVIPTALPAVDDILKGSSIDQPLSSGNNITQNPAARPTRISDIYCRVLVFLDFRGLHVGLHPPFYSPIAHLKCSRVS